MKITYISVFIVEVLLLLETKGITSFDQDSKNQISVKYRRGSEITDDKDEATKSETKKRGIILKTLGHYQGYGHDYSDGKNQYYPSGFDHRPPPHNHHSSKHDFDYPSPNHHHYEGHGSLYPSGHNSYEHGHEYGHGYEDHDYGGHGKYGVKKALALKGLLIPLAGIALLGAAAAFSNPVLLQLGVLNGRRRRRRSAGTGNVSPLDVYPQNPFVKPSKGLPDK